MTATHRAIGDVATQLGLSPDTLRYFERRGIVPPPARDDAGRRVYTDRAVHLLEVLLHLRRTGMPLAQIAEFTGLVGRDPDGVPERLELLITHREHVKAQRKQLDASLRVIEGKIDDYQQRLIR